MQSCIISRSSEILFLSLIICFVISLLFLMILGHFLIPFCLWEGEGRAIFCSSFLASSTFLSQKFFLNHGLDLSSGFFCVVYYWKDDFLVVFWREVGQKCYFLGLDGGGKKWHIFCCCGVDQF